MIVQAACLDRPVFVVVRDCMGHIATNWSCMGVLVLSVLGEWLLQKGKVVVRVGTRRASSLCSGNGSYAIESLRAVVHSLG